jgi:hypothetical protein
MLPQRKLAHGKRGEGSARIPIQGGREQAHARPGGARAQPLAPGHPGGVVDIPNACVSIYLPTEIFKRPIVPQDVPTRVASEAQLLHAPGEPQINLTQVEVPES